MKIDQSATGYFLMNPNDNYSNGDKSMAELFGMKFKEYKRLLIKYGARLGKDKRKEYYFETREECENFLNSDELLPYIMMLKLED